MLEMALLDKANDLILSEKYSEALSAMEKISVEKLCRGEADEVAKAFDAIPEKFRSANIRHCLQEIQIASLFGEASSVSKWFNYLIAMRERMKEGTVARAVLEECVCYASLIRPMTDNAKLLLMMAVLYNDVSVCPPIFISVTGRMPSIIRGRKDLSDWSHHYRAVSAIIKPMLDSIRGEQAQGILECARAELLYERNDLTAATVENAGALSSKDPEVLFAAYAQLARTYCLDPAAQNNKSVMEHIADIIKENDADWLLPNFAALKIRFSLLSGETELAEKWQAECTVDEWERPTMESYYEAATKARVYIALGRAREAATLLERLIQLLSADIRTLDMIDCTALSALACAKLGSLSMAIEKLDEALKAAETYGYIRVFADCGAPMLNLLLQYIKEKNPSGGFGRFVSKVVEATRGFALLWPRFLSGDELSGDEEAVELTATEVQILRYLSDGKANNEIAEELNIKLPTVKFHLRNIYDKLGVSSRTAALNAAKKKKLL